eukprot:2443372-Pyramimonas_sp.AAC.1
MPLQSSSAPVPSHLADEPFQLPNDWQCAKIDAAAARSVSKDEAKANQDAQAALRKEWDILRSIGTWNEKGVRAYDDVVAELNAQTAHFGCLFAILVEKSSKLPLGHKDRKYKGRVVFDGSS